jgi:hypothetical protein
MPYFSGSAQAGKVTPKYSLTPGDTLGPAGLEAGEIAVNAADGFAMVGKGDSVGFLLGSSQVRSIVVIEEAAYDLIVEKDPNVLYIVTPDPEE